MATTFADLGRVEAIRTLFEGSGFEPFKEPLRLRAEDKEVVTVQKVLLEGVDFNLVYFPLKHLGYKAVIAASAELYAAMAQTRSLSLTLGVSAKLDYEQIKELWSGVLYAAKEQGYSSLSLELQPSKNGLTICVAAMGTVLPGTPGKAETKDLLCVSGRLGAAYLGQQVLEHKADELEKYKMMVGAYLKPELSPQTPLSLVEQELYPSCACCVSRGLSDAVLRLSRDTGLGVKVYADKIPFEGNSFSLGKELDIDPISAAMNGGDDYQLLLVIPLHKYDNFRRNFQNWSVIGHIARPEVGCVLVTPDGLEHPVSAQGW